MSEFVDIVFIMGYDTQVALQINLTKNKVNKACQS